MSVHNHGPDEGPGMACIERRIDGRLVGDCLLPHRCDRCKEPIPDFEPPVDGMTAGYYDVTGGYWARFANDGESVLCDRCMWSDPAYLAERQEPHP